MANTPLTELQANYVKTFDLTPEHSLHLTHHLFGDDNDKNRGPALIDLGELYKDYGMKLMTNELPDYLPLILEFAALLDNSESTVFLADANKVLTVLTNNLTKANSPYAPLLSVIKSRATLTSLAA
jgi:nitrate reductase delta subunit